MIYIILINKIRQSKRKNNINRSVIITELEDDKYDVNFLEKESDSILSLENLKVEAYNKFRGISSTKTK